uniref:Uncharacterized protein n=1 Tax=Eptatretus burgeri TaxID=7764 RepID=A0A8C4WX65_EPTBU
METYHNIRSKGALVTLWSIMMVNNWHVFMEAYSRHVSKWSEVYFVSWWFISSVVCVNLFIVFIIEVDYVLITNTCTIVHLLKLYPNYYPSTVDCCRRRCCPITTYRPQGTMIMAPPVECWKDLMDYNSVRLLFLLSFQSFIGKYDLLNSSPSSQLQEENHLFTFEGMFR